VFAVHLCVHTCVYICWRTGLLLIDITVVHACRVYTYSLPSEITKSEFFDIFKSFKDRSALLYFENEARCLSLFSLTYVARHAGFTSIILAYFYKNKRI